VRRRADTGGAGDADADVPVVREVGLRGVEADPHPHLRLDRPEERRERQLCVHRRGDGASRAVEGDEEAVPGGVDLPPAVRLERVAQQPPVVGADGREVVVADAADEVGRPFDVAEEERHGPDRQRLAAHRRDLLTGPGARRTPRGT
jgi:hypothetical protein